MCPRPDDLTFLREIISSVPESELATQFPYIKQIFDIINAQNITETDIYSAFGAASGSGSGHRSPSQSRSTPPLMSGRIASSGSSSSEGSSSSVEDSGTEGERELDINDIESPALGPQRGHLSSNRLSDIESQPLLRELQLPQRCFDRFHSTHNWLDRKIFNRISSRGFGWLQYIFSDAVLTSGAMVMINFTSLSDMFGAICSVIPEFISEDTNRAIVEGIASGLFGLSFAFIIASSRGYLGGRIKPTIGIAISLASVFVNQFNFSFDTIMRSVGLAYPENYTGKEAYALLTALIVLSSLVAFVMTVMYYFKKTSHTGVGTTPVHHPPHIVVRTLETLSTTLTFGSLFAGLNKIVNFLPYTPKINSVAGILSLQALTGGVAAFSAKTREKSEALVPIVSIIGHINTILACLVRKNEAIPQTHTPSLEDFPTESSNEAVISVSMILACLNLIASGGLLAYQVRNPNSLSGFKI